MYTILLTNKGSELVERAKYCKLFIRPLIKYIYFRIKRILNIREERVNT